MKKLLSALIIVIAVSGVAYAVGDSSNPFSQASEKLETGMNHLLNLATVICALVIAVVGLGTLVGNFRKETAFKVVCGALIIAGASQIANFLIG